MCESRNNLDEIIADDDDSSVRSFRSVKSNRTGDDFTSVRSFRSSKSSRSMKRSTAPIKETVLTRAARLLQGEPVPDELLLSNEFVDSDLIELEYEIASSTDNTILLELYLATFG